MVSGSMSSIGHARRFVLVMASSFSVWECSQGLEPATGSIATFGKPIYGQLAALSECLPKSSPNVHLGSPTHHMVSNGRKGGRALHKTISSPGARQYKSSPIVHPGSTVSQTASLRQCACLVGSKHRRRPPLRQITLLPARIEAAAPISKHSCIVLDVLLVPLENQ